MSFCSRFVVCSKCFFLRNHKVLLINDVFFLGWLIVGNVTFYFLQNYLNNRFFQCIFFFRLVTGCAVVNVGCLLTFYHTHTIKIYSNCSRKFGDLKYSGTGSSMREITLYMDFFHDCSVSLPP